MNQPHTAHAPFPTPEQAYADAPSIFDEIGWTVRTLAARECFTKLDREFYLRKAALLDRIALLDEPGNPVGPLKPPSRQPSTCSTWTSPAPSATRAPTSASSTPAASPITSSYAKGGPRSRQSPGPPLPTSTLYRTGDLQHDPSARHAASPGSPPTIVALCAGYGGLEAAIRATIGGQVAAFAENDPHAATVFAARHPNVPNIGDITTADWDRVRDVFRPDVVGAGFPAATPPTQDEGTGSMASGRASGKTSLRLWASFDRASSSWKTWRRSARGGWTSSPQTWPRSGMTRAGHAYALVTPKQGPRTNATAGSQLPIPLMPTPTSSDGTGGPGTSPKRKGGLNLRTAVTRLPAPPTEP